MGGILRPAAAARFQAQHNATLCVHTVLLAAPTDDPNGYPDKTYGTDISYAAFVEEDIPEIRDTAGAQSYESGTVTFAFPGPPAITADYRLTLPDGRVVRITDIARDVAASGDAIQPLTVKFG